MTNPTPLDAIARLPMPGDNVAIATRDLAAGTVIGWHGQRFALSHGLLEGHRFAIEPIAAAAPLLSWNLPFGQATRDISPGEYVCNAGMLAELGRRNLPFDLPAAPNFADRIEPYRFDEANFRPGEQVSPHAEARTFWGYRRAGGRGVGTRNYIILLGTTSRTAGYVRRLEARLKLTAATYPNIDGIVAVAHTEGDTESPNNLALLLRTLAGFMVHPNVGAVLAVDYGVEAVTNARLRDYMAVNNYPLEHVRHHFLTLGGGFEAGLDQGELIVRGWLDAVNAVPRSEEPVAALKIALQCGGSDAFSGISGNPLAAWVAKEIIRYGGAANLAETDELIGAESYVLQNVKDVATARNFLDMVERFKQRVAWHGTSAEGNPSGGNKYRGLYNISLKSIGAAMKRHPEVRLDAAIDYGQPMTGPGFYFMDSPGNDLESIAGQVASGCTMIFFVTGNGSITNFPFVPTIKVVTTSRRYALLAQDMDVNAGAYLDGTPLDEVGRQMLDLTIEVASGQASVGERAGHAQVQLWRDWPQADGSRLEQVLNAPSPEGRGLALNPPEQPPPAVSFPIIKTEQSWATDLVGLILPTSLCAGQIARMTAEQLNQRGLGRAAGLSRFVSLVHTEGCGVSGADAEAIYARTLVGYLTHPLVKHCLLLEHGCEKTHNDYFRGYLTRLGLDPNRFGWASIQLDGGIEAVRAKIEGWFERQISGREPPLTASGGLDALRVGLVSTGSVSVEMARSLAALSQWIAGAGGLVVVPGNSTLLTQAEFSQQIAGKPRLQPSLAYGQQPAGPGFQVMDTPSTHWSETLTGLAATGVEIIIGAVSRQPMAGHPLVPLVQITAEATVQAEFGADLDLYLQGDPAAWPEQILSRLGRVIAKSHLPRAVKQGNLDFQITRGLLGVSM